MMNMNLPLALCVVLLSVSIGQAAVTIKDNRCEESTPSGIVYKACLGASTYPKPYGNTTVLISPSDITCGNPAKDYIDFKTQTPEKCSGDQHSAEKLYDFKRRRPDFTTWWQSQTCTDYGADIQAVITISFGKMLMLADNIDIDFRSARPRDAVIEKSMDYGKTWTPLQAFSRDCSKYTSIVKNGTKVYGNVEDITLEKPYTVVCDERYSGPVASPMILGILERYRDVFGIGPGSDLNPLYRSFNMTPWNDFHLLSDLRIHLTNPAIDGCGTSSTYVDQLMSFFAISHITIATRCWCNLHGRTCLRNNEGLYYCQCQHNTAGVDCEKCKPLYNERPWAPGRYDTEEANECIKCNCSEHADSCKYNETLSGGQCIDCYHNTEGVHCETCVLGYYRNLSVSLTDPAACTSCACEANGVLNGDMTCLREPTILSPIGQCSCKPLVKGRACDVCVDGYYGLLLPQDLGVCKECQCNLNGTGGPTICEPHKGQCPCKVTIEGRACDRCMDTYYDFPSGGRDEKCKSCSCTLGASTSPVCDKVSGQCSCRANIDGRRCENVQDGHYYPYVDSLLLKASRGTCDEKSSVDTATFTGQHYMSCAANQTLVFDYFETSPHLNVNSTFMLALRFTNVYGPWTNSTLTMTVRGNSNADVSKYSQPGAPLSPQCPLSQGANTLMKVDLSPGTNNAWTSSGVLDVRCRYQFTLNVGFPETSGREVNIDSLVILPDVTEFEAFTESDLGIRTDYVRCMSKFASLNTRQSYVSRSECQDMTYSVSTQLNNGAIECNCDPDGTVANTRCEKYGGQCRCKPGVFGRRCDQCRPGYFNFTSTGCTPCDCDKTGSSNLVCDFKTGQCPCKINIALATDLTAINTQGDRQCRLCKADFYKFSSGRGCTACNCNSDGQLSSQCDQVTGLCKCKPTVGGDKCDRCLETYFNFSSNGCSPCGCTDAGSLSLNCDQTTGNCSCKANVYGSKCDQCVALTFNMATTNPDGCQPCFCYGHGVSCTSAKGFVEDTLSLQPSPAHLISNQQRYLLTEFAGNRVSSYGQSLTVILKYEFAYSLSGQPIVFLQSSSGSSVFYKQTSLELINSVPLSVEIMLHEKMWYHNSTHHPSPREFYDILADLSTVVVVRKFGSVSLEVLNVSMATVAKGRSGTPFTGVEQCACRNLSNTQGLSCEQCDTGHKRPSVSGTEYDVCSPCNCSGRSQDGVVKCDELTGVCQNCRVGTTGDDCSQCAPHVIGSECDRCEMNYTNLGRNGCVLCNCDPIGSLNKTCDQVTGQCYCKDRVTGQHCDRCQDNYYNITAGCIECDACYQLVGDEVVKLRELRDNLTILVTEIDNWDNSDSIGSFVSRLSSTVYGMNSLINFLNSANSLGDQVQEEIQRLNASLQHFNRLMVVDDGDVQQANISLTSADGDLSIINAAMLNTRNLVTEGSGKLRNELVTLKDQLATQISGLDQIEEVLTALSTTIGQKVAAVTADVVTIEARTQNIVNISNLASQMAKSSEALHQNVTSRISILNNLVTSIRALETTLQKQATEGTTTVSVLIQEVTDIAVQVDSIGDVPYSTQALLQQAETLKTSAENLRDQSNQALVTNQTTAEKVRNSQQVTGQLTNDVVALLGQSERVLQNAQTAHAQAEAASQLEADTFRRAEEMLLVMKEFDQQSTEAENTANESLQQVTSVRSLSEAAIVSAGNLRNSLTTTQESSRLASQIAQQARLTAQAIKQQLTIVTNTATDLEASAGNVLNDLSTMSNNIKSKDTTVVQPVGQYLATQKASIDQMVSGAGQAKTTADIIGSTVTNSQISVTTLQQQLLLLGSLDTDAIAALVADVARMESEFNANDVRTAVRGVIDGYKVQQKWIEEMTAKKDVLKQELQQLKLLQASLP